MLVKRGRPLVFTSLPSPDRSAAVTGVSATGAVGSVSTGGYFAANEFDMRWNYAPGPYPECNFAAITNNYTGGGVGLTDYGPSNTCTSSPHAADIVENTLFNGGGHLLRFAYPVGFGTQGPDFRLPYTLRASNGNITGDFYCAWYMMWSANYYWRESDSKTMIWGGYHGGLGQDYYWQTYGLAGNRTARVTLYNTNVNQTGTDGFVRCTNFTIEPNVPYLWEFHAHYAGGTSGFVHCWINNTRLTWEPDRGTAYDPDAHDNSHYIGVNFVKFDGTYNVYEDTGVQDWITANGTMYKYYGGWRGGTLGRMGPL